MIGEIALWALLGGGVAALVGYTLSGAETYFRRLRADLDESDVCGGCRRRGC